MTSRQRFFLASALAALTLGIVGSLSPAGARTDTYAYDEAGRLVEARLGEMVVTYSWDPAGNLLTRTVPEPGAGTIAAAALLAMGFLRRRSARGLRARSQRGARAPLVLVLAVAGLGSATTARAQCDPIDPPLPSTNIAVETGDGSKVRVQCDELCTLTASVSPDPGPVSISPEMVDLGPGVPFDFLLLADADATDGDTVSVFIQYSCPGGGSSFDYRAYIQAIDNQTIESKGGGTDADPVSTRNGELFKELSPDLDLGGPLPLRFQRYYASNLLTDARTDSRLGDNWLHNFRWELRARSRDAVLTTPVGRTVRFLKQGDDWVLIGPTAIPFQLADNDATNGTTLYDPRTALFYEFSIGDVLLSVRDGNGNTHTLGYSLPGPGQLQLDSVSDGLGRTLSFTYTSGLMKSVSDGNRTVLFDHSGNDLSSVTDATGQTTLYAYDSGALLVSETRPEGNVPFSQTWSTGGGGASSGGSGAGIVTGLSQVMTQTDADGNSVGFAYAAPSTTITDVLGSRTHLHDAAGELTQSTDRTGESVSIELDDDGRRSDVTDRFGDTTSTAYDAVGGAPETITHADGTESHLAYTSRTVGSLTARDLTTVTNTDGTTETLGYDADGNRNSRTDPAGNVSTTTYDGNGRTLTATNPETGTTTMAYDGAANPISHTDPAGNTTTIDYDAMLRPELVTYEDTETVGLGYDANDNVTSRTDERGNITTVDYDDNGNPGTLTDPQGSVSYGYDGNDRATSRTDRTGRTMSVAYDATGRLASSTDEGNNTTTFDYDARGRLSQVTQPEGNGVGLQYDAEGLLAILTDGRGESLSLSRDAMGRATQLTTPRGDPWRIDYDLMGRPSLYEDPEGGETTVARDPNGAVSAIMLPGGTVTGQYEYDGLGNLDRVWDPNGQPWERAHDTSGRPVSRTDPLGQTTTIDYDERNRVSGFTFAGSLGSLQIARDEAGNPTAVSGSDGTAMTMGYDSAGRATSGTGLSLSRDAEGRVTDSNGIGVTYNSAGLPETMTLAPGVTVTYGYDANGRPTTVDDSFGNGVILSYDGDGNLASIVRSNGTTTTYSYDEDGKLIGIDEGSFGDTWLTRDALGRVTGVERTGIGDDMLPLDGISQGFDDASQVEGAGYDELGRMVEDGSDSYDWSLGGPLWSHTRDGETTDSEYDAFGNRTSRTRGGETRDYVWNYALDLSGLSIERDGGEDQRYWVHLTLGHLLYRIDPETGAPTFYHFNESGDTTFLTDGMGNQVAQYRYSPFGRIDRGEGQDEPFTYRGQFGGFEDSPGLHLIPRFGWYDSDRQRYMERQPDAMRPNHVNPYDFFGNNPFRLPTGLPRVPPIGTVPSVPELIDRASGPQVDRTTDRAERRLTFAAQDLGSIFLDEFEDGPLDGLPFNPNGLGSELDLTEEEAEAALTRLSRDLLLLAAALQRSIPFEFFSDSDATNQFPLGPLNHREAPNKPELAEPRPGKAPSLRLRTSF